MLISNNNWIMQVVWFYVWIFTAEILVDEIKF